MQKTGIIVIGAGIAGWSVVEAIREHDAQVPITLVCACSGDRYHKPELSVALSRGLNKQKLVRETGTKAAERLGVRLLNHTFAVGLLPKLRQLRTTRGTLQYTQLVMAQGSRCQLPEGLPVDQCWRINDLRCWHALAQTLNQGPQRVAVIGAGMVGCELAEDMAKAGHFVTLINRGCYPLAHLLPAKAGERLLNSMTDVGIKHLAETCVQSVTNTADQKRLVRFADGHTKTFDLVIAATGLLTENRLARQAKLAFDRGIVVDAKTLRASEPDIYALGDCISLDGEPCRFIEPIAHQARVIAQGILALPTDFYTHQPPVVRLKTRSLPVILYGVPQADQAWETVSDTSEELVMEQRCNQTVIAQLRMERPGQSKAA